MALLEIVIYVAFFGGKDNSFSKENNPLEFNQIFGDIEWPDNGIIS